MKAVRVKTSLLFLFAAAFAITAHAQDDTKARAEAIIQKAVQNMGGDRYLNVKTQVGRGKFSLLKKGGVISFQSFLDIIVFPDRELTEFKGGGARTVQVNTGEKGWIFDNDSEIIKEQTPIQVANFLRGIRTSLDTLLRGHWKEEEGSIAYGGRRPSTLGKRNDVIRLTYKDGFTVEFEFAADDGTPQKAIYARLNINGEEVKEEDRYAQFIEVSGVRAPFIVDRFTDGVQSSRINYESIEFNKAIPDSIFAKPASVKDAKKEIKM